MLNLPEKIQIFFKSKGYSLPHVYKLTYTLVGVIVSVNLLVFAFFCYSLYTSSQSYIAQIVGIIHQNVSTVIETRIDDSIRILKLLAYMDRADNRILSLDVHDKNLEYIATQYGFSHITFCDNNGTCISTDSKHPVQMSETTYLRETLHSQQPRVSPLRTSLITKQRSINIYVPVIDDHHHAQGAIIGRINLTHFIQSFEDILQLRYAKITLLDDDYNILLDAMQPASEYAPDALKPAALQCIMQHKASTPHFTFEQHGLYMHIHAIIPEINWTLVIKINAFTLFGDVLKMQLTVLGALLFTTLLTGFLVFRLAHSITMPIDSLVNSVQNMNKDEPESDDIVQFITTAMTCTKNMLQSKEFFYSIDRKTNKVELSFGDFQLMTGFSLPRTAHEIDALFLENILPNDKENYEYAQTAYGIHAIDKEHGYTTSFWMRTKNSTTICISYTITNIYDNAFTLTNSMIRLNDITEQQKREESLKKRAQMDAATGIYNKRSFEDIAQQIIESSFADQKSTLVLVDIDNFKAINDTYGHAEGDKIIKKVADILMDHSRNTDRVGRIGGDEFAVLFVGLMQYADIATKISSIITQFSSFIEKENLPSSCSISIGLATLEEEQSFNQLFRHADTALYCAKHAGKGRYCCYDPSLDGNKDKEENEGA